MHYYCSSCGTKNLYIDGVKPKFCNNCGQAIDSAMAKTKAKEEITPSSKPSSGSNWRDEWKGKGYVGNSELDEIDLNEVMKDLKRESGIGVEKSKMLTVGALKEMKNFSTDRDSAPEASKDLASTRTEIMKNLGVQFNQ